MSYADIEERKQQLIRKALKGSVFIANITADAITALTAGATADLSPLPTGYSDLGWLTEEGMPFGRDVGQSNVTSFGSQTPTRSDVTSDTTTLTVIPQETKGITIGLYTGADMAAIEAAFTTGETWIEKPETTSSRFYRVLALSVDHDDTGEEIYIARFMPRAKVTGYAAQSYQGGDAAVTWGVTFTSEKDSTLGYSEAYIFGGPGWLNLLADMDITQATAVSDTTPPTAGTLAGSAITDTTFTLTVSGASDETALDAAPYSFSTDDGTTWSAYQAAATLNVTGLTAKTSYTCVHRVKDAAGNVATGTPAVVTTTA